MTGAGAAPLVAIAGLVGMGSAEVIADAWTAERETFRAVVRWRALYTRSRQRMEHMPRAAAARLHYRLKDLEYDAIDQHQAAERWLRAVAGARLGAGGRA